MKTTIENPENLKKLEAELQKLTDEQILKVFLNTIKVRFRAKEIKNLGLLQEILKELGGAGI